MGIKVKVLRKIRGSKCAKGILAEIRTRAVAIAFDGARAIFTKQEASPPRRNVKQASS